jgi:hypothetical protein
MLIEAFTLVLQLPPLAFNTAAPPSALRPLRELTCPVGELGRPWSPPAPRPLWTARLSVDPRSLRPRDPQHLVNPLADFLLLFALAGWASSTGGTVDFRAWPERNPMLAAPVSTPIASDPLWANPRF